jgi:L-cysteine:1D-myo-inositol 2-amino-2-deoxy-alpha-D-glucopyranoside ligase
VHWHRRHYSEAVHAWQGPPVPSLPGDGLPLRLFDTATREVRPTAPGPTARLYVCGITPYDATHLGHAMTYLTFDLVHRVWLDGGHPVRYVQNVTDIDDPLLERAVATGEDWRAIAERETELFRRDMAALRVLPPTEYIGAVEAMPLIGSAVRALRERGATYQVDDDTYFDLAAHRTYGAVSGLDRHTMAALFGERGGDPERPGKRDPLDPVLWQAARPDEPAWDTELGHGRPGWHIECVAIAQRYLGVTFDVQGGGRDLAFPHHEMGASQGEVIADGARFARHYVHVGMVGLDGEKMSKSRGNLVFVSRLLAQGVPAAVIRLALLDHHYRDDWEWTDADLAAAGDRYDRWLAGLGVGSGPAPDALLARMRERLSDDLDAPAALRAVDVWAQDAVAGRGRDRGAPQQVRQAVDALLGVVLPS